MANPNAMPMRRERTAPVFDVTKPRTLNAYFEELDMLFGRANIIDDQEKKQFALRYVDYEIGDDWKSKTEFADPNATFEQWRNIVYKLYPGADAAALATRGGLQDLVNQTRKKGIRTLGDWAEFHRTYHTQSKWLIDHGKISTIDQNHWATMAIGPDVMKLLATRLITKNPDVHPVDGYTLTMLDEAMRWQLLGTSLAPSAPGSTSPVLGAPEFSSATPHLTNVEVSTAPPTSVTIKNEDVHRIFEFMSRMSNSPGPSQVQEQQPQQSYQRAPNPAPYNPGCHYCNDPAHGVANCPAVEEDIRAGKTRRNFENKVVLSTGGYVPRGLVGECMRDRINEWHRQHPNQLARGTMSYSAMDNTIGGSMMFDVTDSYYMEPELPEQKGQRYAFHPEENNEAEIATLQQHIFALRGGRPPQ